MKTTVKKLFCVLCAFLLTLSLSACWALSELLNYGGYRGQHRDLYTVAVNNVFGIRGHESNGEVHFDPIIKIVETDSYGRTLFFYSEYYDDSIDPQSDIGMAFVVMQKSEGEYVYYYQDKCYIPYFGTTDKWETVSAKADPAVLEQLKTLNDWNQPFDEAKCAKAKISKDKPEGKLRPDKHVFNKAMHSYEVKNGYTGEDDSIYSFSYYCETDLYGRELHYAYGMTMNTLDSGEKIFDYCDYAVIFNADGTCPENGIMRIHNIEDSFAVVNTLKQSVGWNIPVI